MTPPTRNKTIVLASASPRRRELLQRYLPGFRTDSSTVDEVALQGEKPEVFACRAAREKAEDVATRHADALVIGADTVVALGRRILGKPRNPEEAATMLRRLSGRTHRVVTGIALVDTTTGHTLVEHGITRVRFSNLDDTTINAYVANGEPLDKAGAYGIQGLGGAFVERIEGCYYNVVGLPLNLLGRMLETLNIRLLGETSGGKVS